MKDKCQEAYEKYMNEYVIRTLLEWKINPKKVKEASSGLSLKEVDKLIIEHLKTYGYEYNKNFGGYVSEQITTEEGMHDVVIELAEKYPWLSMCLDDISGQRLETHDATEWVRELGKKIKAEKKG